METSGNDLRVPVISRTIYKIYVRIVVKNRVPESLLEEIVDNSKCNFYWPKP